MNDPHRGVTYLYENGKISITEHPEKAQNADEKMIATDTQKVLKALLELYREGALTFQGTSSIKRLVKFIYSHIIMLKSDKSTIGYSESRLRHFIDTYQEEFEFKKNEKEPKTP